MVEAALATDDASGIGRVAVGAAAAQLVQVVREQARRGVVRRGHVALNPRAVLLRDGRAVVTDCLVSSGLFTYRRDTGARAGPPPEPERTRLRALLVSDGTTWKVAETNVPKEAGC